MAFVDEGEFSALAAEAKVVEDHVAEGVCEVCAFCFCGFGFGDLAQVVFCLWLGGVTVT